MRLALLRVSALLSSAAVISACGASDPASERSAAAGASGGKVVTAGGASSASGGTPAGSGGTPAASGSGGSGGMSTAGATTGGTAGSATAGSGGCERSTPSGAPDSQAPGTWINVTPPGLDLSGGWLKGPSQIGVQDAVVDPAVPSDVYLFFETYGIFKSTDYGMTYTKVSTGENSAEVNRGRPWSVAIDKNPCRSASTPPTMYVNSGYGANGLWKSTDGGVNFKQVFTDNIYAPDGVTNISSHVGTDVGEAYLLEPTTTDHLALYMHGQPDGSPEYNGLYETTDGGGKWILRQSGGLFVIATHSDCFAPIDVDHWVVAAGILSPGVYMYRSSDGGGTWDTVDGPLARGMVGGSEAVSFQFAHTESAVYTESLTDGVWKTTDKGASWTKLPNSGSLDTWVVATKTHVYTSSGSPWDPNPTFYHAALDNDTAWTSEPYPEGMFENGVRATVTFDGSHYVIIAAQHKAGVWRYVEP